MKLVSCIMPTRGRRDWSARAVEAFHAQTYPNKQLVILDDIDEPSFDEEPAGSIYARSNERVIGVKRNMCCSMATGEIIAHWDSDDWSAPGRIDDQVGRLEQTRMPVTGYWSILFYEEHTGRWGRWILDRCYAFGTSLCYLKSFWEQHRFAAKNVGEDNQFVMEAGIHLACIDGTSMIVARAHPDNTSPKDMGNCRPVDPTLIPEGFVA